MDVTTLQPDVSHRITQASERSQEHRPSCKALSSKREKVINPSKPANTPEPEAKPPPIVDEGIPVATPANALEPDDNMSLAQRPKIDYAIDLKYLRNYRPVMDAICNALISSCSGHKGLVSLGCTFKDVSVTYFLGLRQQAYKIKDKALDSYDFLSFVECVFSSLPTDDFKKKYSYYISCSIFY